MTNKEILHYCVKQFEFIANGISEEIVNHANTIAESPGRTSANGSSIDKLVELNKRLAVYRYALTMIYSEKEHAISEEYATELLSAFLKDIARKLADGARNPVRSTCPLASILQTYELRELQAVKDSVENSLKEVA